MDFLKIRKQIYATGFDEFHQAGSPSIFHKMNVVAESRVLNKQYWICVDGGYGVKDSFYIAFRPLDDTSAHTERIYCKNQTEVVNELKKIALQIEAARATKDIT